MVGIIEGTLYQSGTHKEKELENIRAASEFYLPKRNINKEVLKTEDRVTQN